MLQTVLLLAAVWVSAAVGVANSTEEGAVYTPQWQPRHVHIAYGNTSSEVVVTWSTVTYSGPSVVEWGTNLFNLSNTTTGNSSLFIDGGPEKAMQWIHRVHLTDLAPATTYSYHVGGHLGWSAVFGFKTVPAETEGWPLRLAVFGDLGAVNAHSLVRLQQEAHQGMYDAVLHVGDMAYNMDTDNGNVGDIFMNQIEPIAAYLPYMTCPGNHENKYDFSQYRNRFSMPNYTETESLYYSFDLGSVHFIAITTEVYYFGPNKLQRMNKQYQWLEKDLKAATTPEARAERPWIVLFGHRPMYCSTNDKDDCTRNTTLTRVGLPATHWYALEPLLAEYGVDLAVWAHEHAYERLFPLYNFTVLNGSVEEPYTNPRGPVHFTTGSAGCDERLDNFQPVQPAWSAKRVSDYGYTRMTIHNKTHLYWEQVSDDQDGALTDSVWLVRDRHETYDVGGRH